MISNFLEPESNTQDKMTPDNRGWDYTRYQKVRWSQIT